MKELFPTERGELEYRLSPAVSSCPSILLNELFLRRPKAPLILLRRLGREVLSARLLPPGVDGL